jgi:hypothetical protein
VVVSENYNHTSFVRTIGLVLGLPAMTRFDRTATPLTACFTETPDLTPYTHLPNRIPLEASERLDWSDIDRADATIVARAVWHSTRPGVPFPWHAFKPNPDDDD